MAKKRQQSGAIKYEGGMGSQSVVGVGQFHSVAENEKITILNTQGHDVECNTLRYIWDEKFSFFLNNSIS